MKKIIIALLAVLLCCSSVFADSFDDIKVGKTTTTLKATFGFDKDSIFKLNTAEGYVSFGTDTLKTRIGYRYLSDAGLLNSFYGADSDASTGEHETGLFADLSVKVSNNLSVGLHTGYRLFPVISNSCTAKTNSSIDLENAQYVTSTKDSYKGLMGTVSYLDKGFYANVDAEWIIIDINEEDDDGNSHDYGCLKLKTGISADLNESELNLSQNRIIASYDFEEALGPKHDLKLNAGTYISTDKDSDGKLFVTSTKTFGKVNYSYQDKYLLSSTGIYFKSYADKSVEDGLYTQNSFAWRVSDEKFMEPTKAWFDNLKLRVAVNTWAPKENGELKLAKVTTNEGLDVNVLNNRLGGSLNSYYNHFVDNEEGNYFYTENSVTYQDQIGKDVSIYAEYLNNILVNKVAEKLNVIEAEHRMTNTITYKDFDLEADVDFKHSQDNDPEKNRIITDFVHGYTIPKNLTKKLTIDKLRIFSELAEKYYKQGGEYVKNSSTDSAGVNITF